MSLFKIKDYIKPERVKNVYRSGKKQSEKNKIESIGNLFKLKKENKAIKDRIIRDIRALFKQKEKYYYIPIRVGNFWHNNYIKYESSGDRNKNLLQYLDKILRYSNLKLNHAQEI